MTRSRFVIMKHEAKRAGLHYDLRFKKPGSNMWDSFAVRKGVPEKPGQKVLAVRTTLHTEKEALFTGTIKPGEYGAGKLTKFDGGSCDIIKYTPAHIILDFKGSKIKGIYHMVSTKISSRSSKDKEKAYFLFKGKVKTEGDTYFDNDNPEEAEEEETGFPQIY